MFVWLRTELFLEGDFGSSESGRYFLDLCIFLDRS
jgi:hypothetical protein